MSEEAGRVSGVCPPPHGRCRGNSTADVRFSGLDDGTIARVSLKGFMAHKRHRGFILVRPLREGKRLRLVGLVLLGRRFTWSGFALPASRRIDCCLSLNRRRVVPLYRGDAWSGLQSPEAGSYSCPPRSLLFLPYLSSYIIRRFTNRNPIHGP